MAEDGTPIPDKPNFPGYANPAGATPGQQSNIPPEKLALVQRTRDLTTAFIDLLHEAGGSVGVDGQPEQMKHRDLSLALTHLEDAEYRAIRYLTGGPIRKRAPKAA